MITFLVGGAITILKIWVRQWEGLSHMENENCLKPPTRFRLSLSGSLIISSHWTWFCFIHDLMGQHVVSFVSNLGAPNFDGLSSCVPTAANLRVCRYKYDYYYYYWFCYYYHCYHYYCYGYYCKSYDYYYYCYYYHIIWANYNISLTWIVRPFGDDFPNPNYDFQWGRSEVVMKFTQILYRPCSEDHHQTRVMSPCHLCHLGPQLFSLTLFQHRARNARPWHRGAGENGRTVELHIYIYIIQYCIYIIYEYIYNKLYDYI